MINRLSLATAVFAVLATATLAFAADAQHRSTSRQAVAATAPMEVVQLPRVEIIGHRIR